MSSNYFDEKEITKIKIRTREEKNSKIKQQMNEHEISIHVSTNSRIQIVQSEFTV